MKVGRLIRLTWQIAAAGEAASKIYGIIMDEYKHDMTDEQEEILWKAHAVLGKLNDQAREEYRKADWQTEIT